MAGLCERGNEPPGSLKASQTRVTECALDPVLLEKKFSPEISAVIWDRCPLSIVMHLGATIDSEIRLRKPAITAGHTIHPFWLDDRPPLLRHLDMGPADSWSAWALKGL
ncbi:hypothetical protein ANN_12498 [Periplaneta americana]|uniref:Uncharacterized protein n=1 Tax=Periplaneta americana TaxID=6978 RepID=A0ABQ8TGP0_PERAM|nr:hypothetical protein ANN_12498 [Periplaneta americana]